MIYILERFNEKSLSLKTCDQINEFNITKQSWSTTIDDLLVLNDTNGTICPNGAYSIQYYKNIISYGNCLILIIILFCLGSISNIQLK